MNKQMDENRLIYAKGLCHLDGLIYFKGFLRELGGNVYNVPSKSL